MRTLAISCFALGLAASAAAQRQTGTSAATVKELANLLESHKQTAIAAKDPQSGAFVAALFYPGVQLLVVTGTPIAPSAVEAQLAAKNFQDVYAALQDGAAQTGRLFVQDLGADGLNDGGDSIDVVYDQGQQTLFDGNPRSHKLSAKAYHDAFTSADARANGLQMLLPATSGHRVVTGVTRNGQPVTFTLEDIKGVTYAVFASSPGAYAVQYATEADIPAIMEIERTPGFEGFVGRWAREKHLEEIAKDSTRYFVLRDGGAVKAFAIFQQIG